MIVQMTGTFDTFTTTINGKINELKKTKKAQVDLRRRASERSLSMATQAFGEGIEYVRESVEAKAMNDARDIMEVTVSAREIIQYNLELNKNELWRSISYLAKKLYADERNDYNNKIKRQILEKFKEFKHVIVDATKELQDSQDEQWMAYQQAIANYYKFYDEKIIGAKASLFDVAQ